MYLIQYTRHGFIDANKIEGIYIASGDELRFSTQGSVHSYTVGEGFRNTFLNHLQSFNSSTTNADEVLKHV